MQRVLSRNVTGPHEKFPCEFVNTDFLLSYCSFSLHVHSGFPFPGGEPRQRKSSHPLPPEWSLPRSFLPGRLGITLMLGLLSFPGGWGLLYPFTASSVRLLNGKSQATVLLICFGLLHCSWPVPHLFVWNVFNTEGGCCLCPKCRGLRGSVGSAHSFLLIKDFSLLV